jgi:ABC-type multidrug transport system fused ATPase/permease subunit
MLHKIIFISAMLVILVYLSPYMTSIMLICNIPVIFYFSFALRRSKTYQEEIQDIKAECSVIAEETFSNVKTVKAFATEKYESDRF